MNKSVIYILSVKRMNLVSSTQQDYAEYARTQDEDQAPEYFNLPNLIRVSDGLHFFLIVFV